MVVVGDGKLGGLAGGRRASLMVCLELSQHPTCISLSTSPRRLLIRTISSFSRQTTPHIHNTFTMIGQATGMLGEGRIAPEE